MSSIETVNSTAPPTPDPKSAGAEPKVIQEAARRRVEQKAPERRTEKANPAEKAEALLREIRRRNPNLANRLRIDIDHKARRFVYFSVDRETGEVVKQYPSREELRRLISGQEADGISVDKRV